MPAVEARAQVVGVCDPGMFGVLAEGEVGCVAAVAGKRRGTGRERHRGVEREGRDRDKRPRQSRRSRACGELEKADSAVNLNCRLPLHPKRMAEIHATSERGTCDRQLTDSPDCLHN